MKTEIKKNKSRQTWLKWALKLKFIRTKTHKNTHKHERVQFKRTNIDNLNKSQLKQKHKAHNRGFNRRLKTGKDIASLHSLGSWLVFCSPIG